MPHRIKQWHSTAILLTRGAGTLRHSRISILLQHRLFSWAIQSWK